jgi:hypothetical protein
MSTYKYYHKLTRFDNFFIDGIYINFALPSLELKNIYLSTNTNKYLNHKLPFYNKYTQTNDLHPYPTDPGDDPYYFVKKFLSFAKSNIENSLNNIISTDKSTFPKFNNYLNPHSPKILEKPADWNESYYNGGIRIHCGKHHNLEIHFDGLFFKDPKFNQNITQISKCASLIEYHLKTYIFNIPEWNHIDFPQFTIYQLHLAQNLLKSKFKKGINIEPIPVASTSFSKSIIRNGEKQGYYAIHRNLLPKHFDTCPNNCLTNHNIKDLVSGYNCGITGKLKCTVYDKELDKQHKITHAENRFNTAKFFRREWQIGTKKLESCGIKLLSDFIYRLNPPSKFIGPTNPHEFLSQIIRKIRISCDIILYNDSTTYKSFHDKHDRLPKDKQNIAGNYFRFSKSNYTPMKINKIPSGLLKTRYYNPFKNIKGNLQSKNAKNMTAEQIIKIQIDTLELLKNCALNGHIQSKQSNHVTTFQFDKLLTEIKKFSNNFSSYIP